MAIATANGLTLSLNHIETEALVELLSYMVADGVDDKKSAKEQALLDLCDVLDENGYTVPISWRDAVNVRVRASKSK